MPIMSSTRGVFALSVALLLATDASAIAADNLAGLTGGLPALTSTEYGDGSTSYSLLAGSSPNDSSDLVTVFGAGDDFFHSDYYCSIYFAPGDGDTADTA